MLMDTHFLEKYGVVSLMKLYFCQYSGVVIIFFLSMFILWNKSPLCFIVEKGDLVHLMIAENHFPKDLKLMHFPKDLKLMVH